MSRFMISLILGFTHVVIALPIHADDNPSPNFRDESFEQGGHENPPPENSIQITNLEWVGIIIGAILVVALTVGGIMACRWRLHRNSSNVEMRQRALANYRQAAHRDAAAQRIGRGEILGHIRMPSPAHRNNYEMH